MCVQHLQRELHQRGDIFLKLPMSLPLHDGQLRKVKVNCKTVMEQPGVRGWIPHSLGFENDAWDSRNLHGVLSNIRCVIKE